MNSLEIFKEIGPATNFTLEKSEDIFKIFTLKQLTDPIREKLKSFNIHRCFWLYMRRDDTEMNFIQKKINAFRNWDWINIDTQRQDIIKDIKSLMLECWSSQELSDTDVVKRFLRQEYRDGITHEYLRKSDDPVWLYKPLEEIHLDVYDTLFRDWKIFNSCARDLATCLSEIYNLAIKIVTDTSQGWNTNHAQELVTGTEVLSGIIVWEKKYYDMPLIKIDNSPTWFNPIIYFPNNKPS
jgi:hypothetical protein